MQHLSVALLELLADPAQLQRDKLVAVRAQLAAIRALDDSVFAEVVRAIKKRLNSPKLATEVIALVAELTRDRPLRSAPRPAPPAPIQLVAPASDELRERLEAEIAASPDSHEPYAVYGDLLSSRGDPFGALVAIGCELAKSPTHKRMLAAHAEHLAAHALALFGRIAAAGAEAMTDIKWAFGFIRSLRLAQPFEREDRHDLAAVLAALLDDPGPARFLQDLVVGVVDVEAPSYAPICAVLARRPRPALRSLFLGDFTRDECELNWASIGDASALWPAVPNLRSLTLRAGSMTLGPIDLPELAALTTITGGLDPVSLGHICTASWPALERLSLQIGRGREGAATDVAIVAPLLDATRTPRLAHLGIVNCELTDELCALLPSCKLLPQLRSLDLSMGTMSIAGARALAAHPAALRHLERLDVDDNYLDADALDLLGTLGIPLTRGEQRSDGGDPDHRYAAAFE